ncbi:MAG: TonB family protein [Candidatus Loosdrechtia sp.]|uniref:energy transducer TonB n=1 Tax=Candidatus Loosdrechtia sp. TaxID=3101272 RepID=UPI003A5D8186|nr:MAG: TonB family protein [Candidatus Jettenia sp. AMX2]
MKPSIQKTIFALTLTVLVNGLLFLCLASLNSSSLPDKATAMENLSVRWVLSASEQRSEISERSDQDLPLPETIEFSLPVEPEPLVLASANLQSNIQLPVQQPEMPVETPKKAAEQPVDAPEKAAEQSVVQGIMDVDAVDQPPRPRRIREPNYPADARRQGQQGFVTVRLLINQNGRIDQFEILDRQGPGTFERAVEEVVTAWQFEPARHNGVPVAVLAVQTLVFRLNE